MVPFAYMLSPISRQDGWKLVRSYDSISCGLPRNRSGSAPALVVSRPTQRSLTLRPARSPGHLRDLLHQRLQQFRCLHCCSDCYRAERTSSRAGLTPAVDHHFFTAHPVSRTYPGFESAARLSKNDFDRILGLPRAPQATKDKSADGHLSLRGSATDSFSLVCGAIDVQGGPWSQAFYLLAIQLE
jgi:hypothetical protein